MQKLFLAMAIAIVTATAVSAQKKENMMVVSSVQTDKDDGYEGNSAIRCGIKFNIQLSGVTKIELESVDGNPLAGKANIKENTQGDAIVEVTEGASPIITFEASGKSGFTPGKDYYISTLPCDLYGGYRLSFYKISPLCLATFTADTGFLFTKMASWLIILVFIRQLYWEHL